MGRRTLSGSEMYAHCRNRHEQKHLREKLDNLSEEQFVSIDFLKTETNKWRQFRRENLKNSGWSAAAMRQGKNGKELIALNSPSQPYPKARPLKDQLQLPWVYTYNKDSHNQICKDLFQSSINYKKSLSLRHQSGKSARLSKMSTSSSAESSGNETPRTSMPEERKSLRQLRKTTNAWVYSIDEWRTGDRCPPNTPKTSICTNTRLTLENEFFEDRDMIFVTELKEPKKMMSTSFSTKTSSQSTKSEWVRQSSYERMTTTDMKQTGKTSNSLLKRDVENMDFLCTACGGKLMDNDDVRWPESLDPPNIQKRIHATDTNLTNSNQPFRENIEYSEDKRKGKTKLCRCNSEPSLTQYKPSTLTTDTIKSHFGRNEKYDKNCNLLFPSTKVNAWKNNSTQEDPEDILASSFLIWDLSPYKTLERRNETASFSSFPSRIHEREHSNEKASILSACDDQNSDETSIKLQSLDSMGSGKSVLLPRRRQARDETINRIDLEEVQKFEDMDAKAFAREDLTEVDKIDSNGFQLISSDSSYAKFSDSSEKSQRLPSSLNTQINNQINISDTSIESIVERPPREHIVTKENNNNSKINVPNQRMHNITISSKGSKTKLLKTDRSEEKRYSRVNPRISSGKNGALCGLPKVLQRKTQDLNSQRPSMLGYKSTTKKQPKPSTESNFDSGERLIRSDSVDKSRQKRALIEINVRIPQVVKDEIVTKDAFIKNPSNSKIEKAVIGNEKGHEISDDNRMKVIENCNEDNQNVPESLDKLCPNHSSKNSNIHTEGIKDPFCFTGDHTAIADENEKANDCDNTNNQNRNSTENESGIIDTTTTTIDNNNNDNNNNIITYMEDQTQNNLTETRKRALSASGRLVTGNDDVYHKGILLSNYISPEQRYKMTFKGPNLRPRLGPRSNSFANVSVTNSNSYIIRLNFSKQARQQALAKLIEDNHSARGNSIQKALTESLQARIKAFCVSLDSYRQST